MKIVCISTEVPGQYPIGLNHYDHITVGKKYDVIKTNYIYVNSEEFVDSYRIVNDDDKELSYRVGLFKTLDKIRDEKLEELLK